MFWLGLIVGMVVATLGWIVIACCATASRFDDLDAPPGPEIDEKRSA